MRTLLTISVAATKDVVPVVCFIGARTSLFELHFGTHGTKEAMPELCFIQVCYRRSLEHIVRALSYISNILRATNVVSPLRLRNGLSRSLAGEE
jgi:hypothetical protein